VPNPAKLADTTVLGSTENPTVLSGGGGVPLLFLLQEQEQAANIAIETNTLLIFIFFIVSRIILSTGHTGSHPGK
jgi:hypothetical protein